MKFVYALALLIASVTVFGANAKHVGFENEDVMSNLIQRMRVVDVKALEFIKEHVEKSETLAGEFQDQLEHLTKTLSEVDEKTGEHAFEAAKQAHIKIQTLKKEVTRRVMELNGYAVEETELIEDEEEDDVKNPLLTRIAQRVRAITERALKFIKAKLAESKELAAEFKEKVDEVTAQLAVVAKQTGKKALEAARELREKVSALRKAVVNRIKEVITGSLYEAEEEQDLVEESGIQKVIQRVRAFVQRALERVKDLLSKHKDILEKVKGKVTEVTQKLAELAKEHGQKAIAAAKALRQKIRDLIKDIASRIAEEKPASYSSNYDLRDTVTKIRDLVLADGGIQALRLYLDNLKSTHPTVALVRTYIQSSSDDALLEILEEFFSGLSYNQQAPTSDLANLFRQLRTEVLNEEGIQRLRDYAKTIETVHPIVQRIKIALETRPTDAIIAFLSELFSGLDVYAAPENIQSLVQQVKEQLLLDEGLQRLRTYAGTILPRHPVAILIKLHVIESSDAELRELINELIQVDYYDGGFYEDLKTSMKTIKDFILSQEGIEALKGYFGNLETSHPVVLRLKSLVEQASNDVILQVATEILGNI